MPNLSLQQQHILKWLLNSLRFIEQQQPKPLNVGISWRINISNKERENNTRASLCRSLSRLEQRRLITCIRGRKNRRTTKVMLTDEGRKMAESLIALKATY